MAIARHTCGLSYSRLDDEIEYFHERIARGPRKNPSKARTRAAAIGHGIELAGMLSIKDPADPGIVDALRVTSRAGVALFAPLGAEADVEVEFWEGTVRSLSPLKPSSSTHSAEWLKGCLAAIALRDQYALRIYAETPLEMTKEITSDAELYVLDIAVAVQAYQRGDQETPSLIAKALRSNDPDKLPPIYHDWVLDITVPMLAMLYRIVERREGAFNEELEKALVRHRHYYTQSKDRSNDPSGMIALRPLALACLAYDAGIDIFVKSDYIPQVIIEDQSGLES